MKKTIWKIVRICTTVLCWLVLVASLFAGHVISPLFQAIVKGYALPILLIGITGGILMVYRCRKWLGKLVPICIPLITLVITVAFLVGFRGYMSHFTPLKWKLYREARYVMVDDLKKNHLPIGSSEELATELLGVENTFDGEIGKERTKVTVRTYFIAEGWLDPLVMQVCISGGKVTSISEYES